MIDLYPTSVFEDRGDIATEFTTLATINAKVVGTYDWESTKGVIILPEEVTTSTQAASA